MKTKLIIARISKKTFSEKGRRKFVYTTAIFLNKRVKL